ncbi:hypothetical protein PIB30_101891 [Stylosanthes scabra]|uniref:Dynamin stalk domain-containing protein n=1 Tax=Stylosanthes scabra TaxID=79078 RepID=A0ABU6WYL2_9FABA|nr:hypothetical protein [Stylosanthes scabra]
MHSKCFLLREKTFGVLTKLLLMDKGPNALNADINRNTDMIAARKRESEFFATNPDYSHLASKMGSQHLASLLSKHLESLLRARIPGIASLITRSINELDVELLHLGRPVAADTDPTVHHFGIMLCLSTGI